MDRSAHTPRADVASHANGNATPRFDIFQPGPGLALVGAGLLALAGVEGARLVLSLPSAETQALVATDHPEAPLGAAMTSEVFAEPATPFEPQSAVGTGPGAPRVVNKGAPAASAGASQSRQALTAASLPRSIRCRSLWDRPAAQKLLSRNRCWSWFRD
jgi:hypothetical protein